MDVLILLFKLVAAVFFGFFFGYGLGSFDSYLKRRARHRRGEQ